jgi:hypothetical protein
MMKVCRYSYGISSQRRVGQPQSLEGRLNHIAPPTLLFNPLPLFLPCTVQSWLEPSSGHPHSMGRLLLALRLVLTLFGLTSGTSHHRLNPSWNPRNENDSSAYSHELRTITSSHSSRSRQAGSYGARPSSRSRGSTARGGLRGGSRPPSSSGPCPSTSPPTSRR